MIIHTLEWTLAPASRLASFAASSRSILVHESYEGASCSSSETHFSK